MDANEYLRSVTPDRAPAPDDPITQTFTANEWSVMAAGLLMISAFAVGELGDVAEALDLARDLCNDNAKYASDLSVRIAIGMVKD